MKRVPESCPNCGAAVPRGARACPGCGADERTGWSESAVVDRLDLPGSEGFDYEDYVAREFGVGRRRPVARRAWVGWVAAGLLLALVLLWVW